MSTREQPTLSRKRIAGAALDLVDSEGLEAVSMRRLAQELGVGTMTLYGYFGSKEELMDAVVDAAADRHGAPPAMTGPWRERLAAVARGLHRGLSEHPGLIQLRLNRPLMSPGAMRGTEMAIGALQEAGFEPADAARHFRTLFLYAFGVAAFNVDQVSRDLRAEVHAAFSRLPPDEFPWVSGSADLMADTLGGEEQFEAGLGAILDGFEARLGSSPR